MDQTNDDPTLYDAPVLTRRLERLGDYPFGRLAKLIDGLTPPADLSPLIMSVGEPQHAPPPLLAEALLANGHLWNKYPPVNGTPEFRNAVAGWLTRRYALAPGLIDPETCVLPCAGTREALFLAAMLTIPTRKNNEIPAVLIPNPFYAVYEGAARLARSEPVFLASSAANGFLPDLDALEADPKLLGRTALFYLCSPANPQGSAADRAYLRRAIALARKWNFVLAMDECYSEIYLDEPPPGVFEVAAGMAHARSPWDNLLVFHSLSKRSNAAGMRSGFVAGDPVLMASFSRLRGYANAGTSLPILAAAAALWSDDAHVEANRALYRAKFAAAEAALQGRFGYRRPAGGFFLWLNVGDGEGATRKLWRDGALKVLPGAYLGQTDANGKNPGSPYIRVAVVHDAVAVGAACETIVRLLG